MSFVLIKENIPSLNFFLKATSDAMRENKSVSIDALKARVEGKFPASLRQWLPQIEDLLREAETRLFSYGSLQPGQQNEHMLKNITGYWLDGFVHGERSPKGWGTHIGFPILDPDYTGLKQHVPGKMFTAPGLLQYWKILDDFEGDEYVRVPILVYTLDPETIAIGQVYAASTNALKR